MSTVTKENPKLLCAQRRESFVPPSKPPTFLTPMVSTQRVIAEHHRFQAI